MPQLSPVSWVLVAFFLVMMVVSSGVKVWWGGGVAAYRVRCVPLSGSSSPSRLFAWGSLD